MSHREILDELPLCQGFALIAWAVENNTVCEVHRVGRGYIGLDVDARLAALKAKAP